MTRNAQSWAECVADCVSGDVFMPSRRKTKRQDGHESQRLLLENAPMQNERPGHVA